MDSGELQNTLKRLCKIMWEANLSPFFEDAGGDGRRAKRKSEW